MHDTPAIRERSPETAKQPAPGGAARGSRVPMLPRMISAAGGTLLALYGLRRRSGPGALAAAAGGALVYSAASDFRTIRGIRENRLGGDGIRLLRSRPIRIQRSVTVNRPREEVFGFWRNLENLPQFMRHLENVRSLDDRRSRWVARLPGGVSRLEWEAEITQERPGELIAWRSLPDSEVLTTGVVRFEDAPGDRGTRVHVSLDYSPPAGAIGEAVARLLNPVNRRMIREDMRRFKSLLEAGEIPTTEGQPSGRVSPEESEAVA